MEAELQSRHSSWRTSVEEIQQLLEHLEQQLDLEVEQDLVDLVDSGNYIEEAAQELRLLPRDLFRAARSTKTKVLRCKSHLAEARGRLSQESRNKGGASFAASAEDVSGGRNPLAPKRSASVRRKNSCAVPSTRPQRNSAGNYMPSALLGGPRTTSHSSPNTPMQRWRWKGLRSAQSTLRIQPR